MLICRVNVLTEVGVCLICLLLAGTLLAEVVKADHDHTQTIHFLSLLPYLDPSLPIQPSWNEGQSVFLAEQLAVEHINNKTDILPGYHVELIQANGGCNVPTVAIVSLVEQLFYSGKKIVGIVGPACSSSAIAVASLAQQKRIALINFHLASASRLQNPLKYPYSYGMCGGDESIDCIFALIKHNNWTRIAILYDGLRPFYSSFHQRLLAALQHDSSQYTIFSSAVYHSYIPLYVIVDRQIRVIVLLLGPDLLGIAACLAYHQGLTFPTYQVITSLEADIADEEFIYQGTEYSCSESALWEVANGSIYITYRLNPLNITQQTDTGISYEEFSFMYQQRVRNYNNINSIMATNKSVRQVHWAPAFYDAVWALAISLNRSADPVYTKIPIVLSDYTHGQPDTTEIVRRQVKSLRFDGISGTIRFKRKTGYIQRPVDILLFSAKDRRQIPVAYFDNNTLHITANSTIIWFIPDSFEEDGENVMLVVLSTLLLIVWILELLAVVTVHILNIVYRQSASVKASSRNPCQLAFAGCYCLLISVMSYITYSNLSTSAFQCALLHFANLTYSLGAALVYGVVLVRTWRLYRILVHYRSPGRFISDRWLITFVLLLASVCLCINIVWIVVDPYRVMTDSEGEQTCQGKLYLLWFGVLVGYCGVIILFGVWYAVRCHKMPSPGKKFQMTNVIFLAYAIILIQTVGLPIFILSRQSGRELLTFVTLCIVGDLFVLMDLIILFIPPVWPIIRQWSQCCGQ